MTITAWKDLILTQGLYVAKTVQTDTYAVQSGDEIVVANKATAMSVTLPSATGSGRRLAIQNKGAGDVTVTANGVEVINDETSKTLSQYSCLEIVDTATGVWGII